MPPSPVWKRLMGGRREEDMRGRKEEKWWLNWLGWLSEGESPRWMRMKRPRMRAKKVA